MARNIAIFIRIDNNDFWVEFYGIQLFDVLWYRNARFVRDFNWILYKMHNNKQTYKRKIISKSILTDWNTAFIFDVEHVINLYTITLIILRLPRLLQHTIILGIIITIRSSRTLQISWNPGWWLHDQAVIRETDTNIL